jgi:hypothetical protein
MLKNSNHSHPYREVYNAFQRVMGSNSFIFTQGGIVLVIVIVLGALPALIYLIACGGFISLALAFEKPYQLLRTLLPYGNWPSHLPVMPVRSKIVSILSIVIMLLGVLIGLWIVDRFIVSSPTNLWCDGSLPCILLRRLLS